MVTHRQSECQFLLLFSKTRAEKDCKWILVWFTTEKSSNQPWVPSWVGSWQAEGMTTNVAVGTFRRRPRGRRRKAFIARPTCTDAIEIEKETQKYDSGFFASFPRRLKFLIRYKFGLERASKLFIHRHGERTSSFQFSRAFPFRESEILLWRSRRQESGVSESWVGMVRAWCHATLLSAEAINSLSRESSKLPNWIIPIKFSSNLFTRDTMFPPAPTTGSEKEFFYFPLFVW